MKDKTSGSNESTLQRQLNGYRLTTAEIIYHMPDHPELLQEFIYQVKTKKELVISEWHISKQILVCMK